MCIVWSWGAAVPRSASPVRKHEAAPGTSTPVASSDIGGFRACSRARVVVLLNRTGGLASKRRPLDLRAVDVAGLRAA